MPCQKPVKIGSVLFTLPAKPMKFTRNCLTHWISKLPGSFEIHWVRQYLVNVVLFRIKALKNSEMTAKFKSKSSIRPVNSFYPRPVLAFGYCRGLHLSVCPSVRPCVNHQLVHAITHHPFKLGSLNLDHRCKRPWLRSLLFLGWMTWTFKVKLNSKSTFTPFWACPCHNSPPIEVIISKFGKQKCILALFRSVPILSFIEIDLQFNF